MPLCVSCGERPAARRNPDYCTRCARQHAEAARHSREYRAREKARKAGPPERIELDAEQALAFVAALRVLDTAREVLHVTDVHVRRDVPDIWGMRSRHLAQNLFALADAYDTALGLLRSAVPPAVLPPGPGPRPRLSDATRDVLYPAPPPEPGSASGGGAPSDVRN